MDAYFEEKNHVTLFDKLADSSDSHSECSHSHSSMSAASYEDMQLLMNPEFETAFQSVEWLKRKRIKEMARQKEKSDLMRAKNSIIRRLLGC